MKNLNSITVTIPTLNEEKNILSCIKSIKKSGIKNIIVIDGGSTDNTINILKNSKIEFSKSIIGKDSCNIYLLNQNKGSNQFYFNATNCETKVYYTDLRASSK